MKTYKNWRGIFFFVFAAVITGCIDEEVLPQNDLVANAGTDMAIQVNDEVQLDGSASHDKRNKPFTYKWTVKTQPGNSNVTLTSSTSAKASFKADVAGTYVIQLQISNHQFSASDEVMIIVSSVTPTAVILNENILTDRVLEDIFQDPNVPDYIVSSDIEVHANLEIMPGVVMAFQQDRGLQVVSGSFKAIGGADKGIIFKGIVNTPAYWKGILIYSNNEANEMRYTTIMQAGSSTFSESNVKANLTLSGTGYSGASLKISHSVFSGSGGYGLNVQGMSTLAHFANNAFVNNTKAAAYIPANQLHNIDVVSFSNTNGLETGGTVLAQGNISWKKLTTGFYHVTSDILIKTGVTIDAGSVFKFNTGVSIAVTDDGFLNGAGTQDFKITFASATTGSYWNGILFNSWNENNKLSYCEVTNAGLNKMGDAEFKANIAIGIHGQAAIENCIIKNGLGYGIVAKTADRINANAEEVNTFENLQNGKVFPTQSVDPNKPPVKGVWLDHWSFHHGETDVVANFYNRQSGQWFNGAESPWAMTNAAFGIQFDENGKFTWLIAERSPWTGCESYSAEYIIGDATITPDKITFDMEYWRSKFVNSCDETQNVDTGVETFELELPYTITKIFNPGNGTSFWELKFKNPDNSTFSFYRY